MVGEHEGAVDVVVALQGGAETGAVEDVISEDESDGVVADEVFTDDERLREPVG